MIFMSKKTFDDKCRRIAMQELAKILPTIAEAFSKQAELSQLFSDNITDLNECFGRQDAFNADICNHIAALNAKADDEVQH